MRPGSTRELVDPGARALRGGRVGGPSDQGRRPPPAFSTPSVPTGSTSSPTRDRHPPPRRGRAPSSTAWRPTRYRCAEAGAASGEVHGHVLGRDVLVDALVAAFTAEP